MWLFLKIIGLLFIPTCVTLKKHPSKLCRYIGRTVCMAKSFEVLAIGVIHIDWSADGMYLRSNSADYELLFWRAEDGEHLTTDAEMDTVPSAWATRNW